MRGIFSKLNISKALLTRGLSLVVVFATLVASYAALSMNHTLGWFAKNEKVTASGMITQAYHPKLKVEYTLDLTKEDSWETFTGTIPLTELSAPGDTELIYFRVTSISARPVTVTGFGLDAPGFDKEIPKVDSSGAHYLSTELQTRLLELTINNKDEAAIADDSTSARTYLRENDVSARIEYLDFLAKNDDNRTGFVLGTGEFFVFTVEFHFENKTEDQNVFKNFHSSGKCERTLYISFDD